MIKKDMAQAAVDPLEKLPQSAKSKSSLMATSFGNDLTHDNEKPQLSPGLVRVQDAEYPYDNTIAPWKSILSDSTGTLGDADGSLETSATDDEMDKYEEDTKFAMYPEDDDSDLDENFFFRDFATKSQGDQSPSFKQRHSRRRSSKAKSKLDLAAFAQTLHDNRLSIMHPRESQIVLTEEDEIELANLVAMQRNRLHSTQDLFVPIMQAPSEPTTPVQPTQDKEILAKEEEEEEEEEAQGSKDTMKADPTDAKVDNTDASAPASPVEPEDFQASLELQDKGSIEEDPACVWKSSTITLDEVLVSPTTTKLTSSNSLRLITRKPVMEITKRPLSAEPPSRRQSDFSPDAIMTGTNDEQEPPSPSPQSSGTDNNMNREEVLRKSLSMGDVHSEARQQGWKLSVRRPKPQQSIQSDTTEEHKESEKAQIDDEPQEVEQGSPMITKKKELKLGLFGSLRNVTQRGGRARSNTIRGLMRSFSTAGGLNRQQKQDQEKNQDQSQDQQVVQEKTHNMSPAALAVIQHNVALHNQKQQKEKVQAPIPEPASPKADIGIQLNSSPLNPGNSSHGGNRLVSQLISRATKSKRVTKTVNMQETKSNKRSQIVRRTIIYVQPDSLHALKLDQLNALPLPPKDRLAVPSLTGSCETISSEEFTTATKIGRQTSVRKRVVNRDTARRQQSPGDKATSEKKRWRLVDSSSDEEPETKSEMLRDKEKTKSDLEGLELREMSDGTVVWGIVQKQGNRKSFFASEALQQYLPSSKTDEVAPFDVEVEEEDVKIEQHVLALMGLDPNILTEKSPSRTTSPISRSRSPPPTTSTPPPIPRRSPRRMTTGSAEHRRTAEQVASLAQDATPTDIYYAPGNTLPSLLQMMAESHRNDVEEGEDLKQGMSVEEQLDAVMRSFSSHRL